MGGEEDQISLATKLDEMIKQQPSVGLFKGRFVIDKHLRGADGGFPSYQVLHRFACDKNLRP